MKSSIPFAVFLLGAIAAPAAFSQGKAADYSRAQSLPAIVANKVFRDAVRPEWHAGGDSFWYSIRTGPGAQEFVLVDAKKGTRERAFDHEKMAAALSKALGRTVRAGALPIVDLQVATDGSLEIESDGQGFRFYRAQGSLSASARSATKG
ncbi:MAG TPA: hypothetical protein VNC50_05575, partial [Planctomycetia bacterium]|nr:hypothetical protein [Planctomycetia bacterium]